MGTEVLYPQDLLVHRFHLHTPSFHPRRNFPLHGDLTNFIVNRRPSSSNNKKTSPKPDKRKSTETKRVTLAGDARRKDGGQVTILRRGQSYDSLAANFSRGDARSKSSAADDMAVSPKQIRLAPPPLADVYAGSAFVLSPSPRALPVPSFCNKKPQDCVKTDSDDPATKDLRRLLRLE